MADLSNFSRVEIGSSPSIDPSAKLGYPTGRNIQTTLLKIGNNPVIRSGTVIACGSVIGDNLETGHNVVIREENRIGNNLRIWSNANIDYGCKIGNNVYIHVGCYICQFSVVEDNVFIAPHVAFANDKYPFNDSYPYNLEPLAGPIVKTGARIGLNSTLLPGVVIGEGSFVGSGSVVTKDVPPGVLVMGAPAKVVCKTKDLIEQIKHRKV